MTCAYCGNEVSTKVAWNEVVGWAKHRKQGGTNAVALRSYTGRLACDPCIQRRKLGIPDEQGRLI